MAYSRAYAENYRRIKWAPPRASAPKQAERKGSAAYVMPDITPFVSPVDSSVISSRSQLREHEQKHHVRQCGELKNASDFDNTRLFPQQPREKALEGAYRNALDKLGLL